MAASRFFSRGHFWLWAGLFLGTTGMVIGCNPQALNFLLMPFVDDREQPDFKLVCADKKEVTVAIVTTFAGLETRAEMLPVEADLSERLAFEMRKLAKENKEKIKFVANSKVRSLMNQDASGTLSRQEIGKKLQADFVVNLEINSISLYEKGSSNTLFRGKTEIDITCFDVSKPRNEGAVFQKLYVREYPGARGPIDAGSSSVLNFRTQFMHIMAEEIAHYFLPYQAVRKMD
jgi:hypothetical protein